MAYKIELDGLELKTKEGHNVLGSDFNVEIKELDEEKRSFWAIASDEGEDRDKDIIRVEGWKLKNYKTNPVGLWCHDYHSHPHFKTEKTRVDKNTKQLLFKPVFDTHDAANITWNQFKNGFLNMFSVGFDPIEHALRNPDNWGSGREFTKQELLEISAVPVPANPNAGVLRSAGLIPDVVNLTTLGYSEEYKKMEDGKIWVPISNCLKGFKNPRSFNIGAGVTAVSAIPIYDKDSKTSPAVGYYFDSNVYDFNKINEWLKENNLKTISKKFYVVNVKEDGDFTLKISQEVKDLEIKNLDIIEFKEEDYDEIIEAKVYIAESEKPYPSEHACRLNDPSVYDKFARKNCAQKHDEKCIDVIYGIKDNKSEIQALRYKKAVWDASDAKSHCAGRNGTFEAASNQESNYDVENIKYVEIKYYDKDKNLLEHKNLDLQSVEMDGKNFYIPIFDINFMDSVKTIIEDMKNDILNEVKLMIPVVKVEKDPNEESRENNDIFQIKDSEFLTSLVSQDDKSEKFVINQDMIEDLKIDTKTIEEKLDEFFDQTIKNALGK